ncbi:VOC family protein [Thiomicrospira sp. ALE5]|uniref:VOC family protein n=1 Tax=Thiomicrospira sp. ALE5 TaxID=748650 RepID=UPI0008F1D0A7|nr:VOC family protein [Thiomicrospira sp. ALE5]SFR51943.1 Glyoxalase/Bleomycin resistance protein/Dioxygenase superfamily protein [Thiomicrospira sp. ALE5]
MITGIHHVSLVVSDAERALAFYQSVLGLAQVPRPELGFPGYWLDLGCGQTLHLLEVEDPYQFVERPQHPGRDRHIALSVDNLDDICTRLDHFKIAYKLSQSGREAIFFMDPDLNVIELTEV